MHVFLEPVILANARIHLEVVGFENGFRITSRVARSGMTCRFDARAT
jgi:hypothetical protein